MINRNELKAKIPGWGADLDLKNRPAVPREKTPTGGTGAHWTEPEPQPLTVTIFKSPERPKITPVFGTSCPPRGLSGKLRELAYKLSEGKKSHWLLLIFADRVDVLEGLFEGLFRLNPDNLVTEMGLFSEFKRGGFFSRFGQNRADVRRIRMELAVLALGAVGAGALLAAKPLLGKKAA